MQVPVELHIEDACPRIVDCRMHDAWILKDRHRMKQHLVAAATRPGHPLQ